MVVELDIDFDWLMDNATPVDDPKNDIGPLVCWVNNQAVLMDDRDSTDIYIEHCRRGKSWWRVHPEQLRDVPKLI